MYVEFSCFYKSLFPPRAFGRLVLLQILPVLVCLKQVSYLKRFLSSSLKVSLGNELLAESIFSQYFEYAISLFPGLLDSAWRSLVILKLFPPPLFSTFLSSLYWVFFMASEALCFWCRKVTLGSARNGTPESYMLNLHSSSLYNLFSPQERKPLKK